MQTAAQLGAVIYSPYPNKSYIFQLCGTCSLVKSYVIMLHIPYAILPYCLVDLKLIWERIVVENEEWFQRNWGANQSGYSENACKRPSGETFFLLEDLRGEELEFIERDPTALLFSLD